MATVSHAGMLRVLDGSSLWGVRYQSRPCGVGVVVRRDDRVRQRHRTSITATVADDLGELLNRYGRVADFYVCNTPEEIDVGASDSGILLEPSRDDGPAPVTDHTPKRDIQ